MLDEREIWLNPSIFFRDHLGLRHRHTFLQLGHMKHIVDRGELL
jgi:hypothetical protein